MISHRAPKFGLSLLVVSAVEEAAGALQAMGGAQAILATVGDAQTVSSLMAGLAPRGRRVVLGVSRDPLVVPTGPLVADECSVVGSIAGTPSESEKTLAFSVLTGVRPRIETLPLEHAAEAYRRMKTGAVKFRMVLTMPLTRETH